MSAVHDLGRAPRSPWSRARDFLPDAITLLRIPLGAAFPFVVERPSLALAVISVAAATDVADGWCARALGRVTPGGAMLDVVADKAFIGAVVVTLVATGRLPFGAAALLATREIGELLLLVAAASRGRRTWHDAATSSTAGKLATTLQLTAVGAVLLGWAAWRPLVGAAALSGLVAAAGYLVRDLCGERR